MPRPRRRSRPTSAPRLGDGVITLTWTDPDDAGIDGYEWRVCESVEGRSRNCADWVAATSDEINARSIIIDGLTNGKDYNVKLIAKAGDLTSPVTTFGPVTPVAAAPETPQPPSAEPTPPAAPDISARAGDGSITMTWADPGDAGIDAYDWRICDSVGGKSQNCSDWVAATSDEINARSITIDGLTNGADYNVKLIAKAGDLTSPVTTFGPVTPVAATPETPQPPSAEPTPPAAPDISATAGDGSITMTWADPGDAGIDGYDWRICDSVGGKSQNCSGWTAATSDEINARSITIGGLTNGAEYNVKLIAKAGDLTSAVTTFGPVTPVAAVPEPMPPAAPDISARAGDGSITMTWADPGDAGIDGYDWRICDSVGGRSQNCADWVAATSGETSARSITIDGLTNGKDYKVKLIAKAGSLASPVATFGPVTPEAAEPDTAPAAPDISARAGDGSITMTWTDPGNGGIDAYVWRICDSVGGQVAELRRLGGGNIRRDQRP